jgi:hypothetical protein
MSQCRGHTLMEAFALLLKVRHGIQVEPGELERNCRIAADSSRVASWGVAKRIRRWEISSGYRVLAS